jgi:hypothetical protein
MSTVSFTNFGLGTSNGLGPSGGQPGPESGPQTATRFTAVYLSGGSALTQTLGSGAYYNDIQYAGTAGMSLDGYGQIAYGNLLFNNRYELSDGSGGGQLTLWQGPYGTAAYGSIAGNVINGNNWLLTNGWAYTATLCPLVQTQPQSVGGVEANGVGHRFYNNEVYENSGGGMIFDLSAIAQGPITISSTNPWYSSDTPRYIESNGYGGVTLYGQPNEASNIQGITLDDVLVSSNAVYGVLFQNVQNNGSYNGFINGSCMTGNVLNGNAANVTWPGGPNQGNNLPAPSTPSNLYPTSYTSYHGGQCPAQFVGLTPAPSHTPPWAW